MNVAKWAAFQNKCKKAGSGGLWEIESLARKVSRWRLSGQAGVEGEKRRISEICLRHSDNLESPILPDTDRPEISV